MTRVEGMTLPSAPPLSPPRAPGSVVLIRTLVVVQALIALVGTVLMEFLALLAFVWVDHDADLTAAVIALAAVGGVMLVYSVLLVSCAVHLRPGAENIRRRLVVLESVLLGGVLLLTGGVSNSLGFDSLPTPGLVLGAGAAASLVALLQPSCRAYSAR